MRCKGKVIEETETEKIREGCGFDMTEVIEAIPQDGEVHDYECPKCGNTGTVRRTPPDLKMPVNK